ncbi:MAG: GC-type dockerin domain-anchored protein [Phycisphaerales bacterium]
MINWQRVRMSLTPWARTGTMLAAGVFLLGFSPLINVVHAQTGGVLCSLRGYEGEFHPTEDGYTYDIVVDGNISYVLHYDELTDITQLMSIDFSDSDHPVILDAIDVDDVRSMQIVGQTLYYSIDDQFGIERLDISDPSSLTLLDKIEVQFDVRKYEVIGDRLYYFGDEFEPRVLDISDPSNPIEIGYLPYRLTNIEDFAVVGDRAYITTTEDELRVIDVSNADSPVLVALYSHDFVGAVRIEIDQDALVLRNNYRSFEVFHLDPGGSEILLQWSGRASDLVDGFLNSSVLDVELRNGIMSVAFSNFSVMSVSLEQLDSPELIGYTGLPGEDYPSMGVTENGTILSTLGVMGIGKVRMSEMNAVNPISEGWNAYQEIDGFQYFLDRGMQIEGSILYAPVYIDDYEENEGIGIAAINIADPANPELISLYLNNREWVEDMSVRDGIAYISREGQGLEIVDFRDPAHPQQLLLYSVFPEIYNIEVDGDTLWMQLSDYEYVLLDISNIDQIMFDAFYKLITNRMYSATFADGLLYVSHNYEIEEEVFFDVLTVVDLSDPFRPVRVDRPGVGVFQTMRVHNGVLYGVGDRDQVLYTSPVSDLSQFGSFPTFGDGRSLWVHGEYAYLNVSYERLGIFDVSDPYAPQFEGMIPSIGSWFTVAYDDGVMMMVSEYQTFAVDLSEDCNPGCAADLNGDGVLDFFDVTLFLQAYLDADPSVDFDGDGSLTFYDVSRFLVAYGQGCP